jgi:hypothetical protein
MFRKMRNAFRNWLDCRMKRCTYYGHYLAYGPAELTHIGYHSAERIASAHFQNCSYNGPNLCSVCTKWEERLRA